MNFQPASGCNIALNTFKSIGLPIRDRNQPARPQMVQQSSQGVLQSSQPRSQETTKPFITAYDHLPPSTQPSQVQRSMSAARPTSSQSGPLIQTGAFNHTAYDTIPPSAQPSQVLSRPTSRASRARDGMTEDEFSKPISYIQDPRTRLDILQGNYDVRQSLASRPVSSSAAFGARSEPAMAPSVPSSLLPSPSFDSHRSAFDSYGVRPTSAPETQSAHFLMDSLPLSQMLPPKRELPFPEKPEKTPSQDTRTSNAPTKDKASSKIAKSGATVSKATAAKITEAKAGQGSLMVKRPPNGRLVKLVCQDCGRNDFKGSTTAFILHCNSQHARNFASVDAAIEASEVASDVDTELNIGSVHSKVSKPRLQDQAPGSSAPKARAKKAASSRRKPDKAAPSSAPPKIDSTRGPSDRLVSPIDDSLAVTRKASTPKRDVSKRARVLTEKTESNGGRARALNGHFQPAADEQSSQPGLTPSNIAPAEFLDSLDGWIRKYQNMPAPKPPQSAKEQLAEYAQQSDEDRAKAIDNMICECLEDENFIKLVEDVEGAWRRIGLGF